MALRRSLFGEVGVVAEGRVPFAAGGPPQQCAAVCKRKEKKKKKKAPIIPARATKRVSGTIWQLKVTMK